MTPAGTEVRSVYFNGNRSVDVRTEYVQPQPHEVLVRSHLIGISHGTEMLFYRGPFPGGNELDTLPGEKTTAYPTKYGYMNVGTSESGNRVFAFAPHQSVFAAAPEDLLPIPDGVGWDDAVLYPSVETALQIVHDAAPRLRDNVLVFGLGTIGVLVSELLRRAGARVVCADPTAERRQRAHSRGLETVDPTAADFLQTVRDQTSGGADIVINCSASEEALRTAVEVVGFEGTVVESSWYGERRVGLDLGVGFHRRRVTIRSSQVSHLNPSMAPRWNRQRRTETVWDLLQVIRPGDLITHRIDLSNAATAFELIDSGSPDVQQIVLVP